MPEIDCVEPFCNLVSRSVGMSRATDVTTYLDFSEAFDTTL